MSNASLRPTPATRRTRDAQEIAPRRRGRDVHLARLLAAEGGAVTRRVRRAARERPREHDRAGRVVDELERRGRRRRDGAERPHPAAEVGVAVRRGAVVADLVDLEERARRIGVVGEGDALAIGHREGDALAGLERRVKREEDVVEDAGGARGLPVAAPVGEAQEAVGGLPKSVGDDGVAAYGVRAGAERCLARCAPARGPVGGGVEGVVELPARKREFGGRERKRALLVGREVGLGDEVKRVERRDAPAVAGRHDGPHGPVLAR